MSEIGSRYKLLFEFHMIKIVEKTLKGLFMMLGTIQDVSQSTIEKNVS